MKLGILAFGVLGLVAAFLPIGDRGTLFSAANDQDGKAELIILIAGFAVPIVVALLAWTRPPMAVWQPAAALGAFALVAVKFHIWSYLPDVVSLPLALKLFYGAQVGGVVSSAVEIARPPAEA